MDMNDDCNVIDDLLLVHGWLRDDAVLPDEVEVAWKRVWSWLNGRLAASPPLAIGAAYDGTTKLVEQLHRTALAGQLPLRNSVGMEQLLLRWVIVAEQMERLLAAVVGEEERQPVATANGDDGAPVDEAYQVSYCDDCGEELGYNGLCFNCELREV